MMGAGLVVLVLLGAAGVIASFATPSHDRSWELGQEALPEIVVEGDAVRIRNFRDFRWLANESDTVAEYGERSFRIDEIRGLDVAISHFAPSDFLAHDFLLFRLEDGRDFGISVETRRELGEGFNPIMGLFNAYELIYVVGSYRDLIELRKDIRGERLYLHPTIATPARAQQLFLALAADINGLRETPQFYNTLTNNCTNILARKLESLSDVEIPWFHTALAPGYLNESLYELGLIEREGSFEATKSKHRLQ